MARQSRQSSSLIPCAPERAWHAIRGTCQCGRGRRSPTHPGTSRCRWDPSGITNWRFKLATTLAKTTRTHKWKRVTVFDANVTGLVPGERDVNLVKVDPVAADRIKGPRRQGQTHLVDEHLLQDDDVVHAAVIVTGGSLIFHESPVQPKRANDIVNLTLWLRLRTAFCPNSNGGNPRNRFFLFRGHDFRRHPPLRTWPWARWWCFSLFGKSAKLQPWLLLPRPLPDDSFINFNLDMASSFHRRESFAMKYPEGGLIQMMPMHSCSSPTTRPE